MSFHLSKPTLIEGRREWALFLLFSAAVFALSLGVRYYLFKDFTSRDKVFAAAEVLLQYTKSKNGRSYEVLKLKTDDGVTFYTTSKEPIKNLSGRRVTLLIFPKRVSFKEYLSTPYIPSVLTGVEHERSVRMELFGKIRKEHSHPWLQELFGALFLAIPISKELRERVNLLGINHLLALSGFHMGLLWLILYGGLGMLYKPLQQRFFPWRHRLLDVGAVTLLLLGAYLIFTGMPPSLMRAYAMVVVGWIALLFGFELLSFSFLAFCVVLLLALFPPLLFSVGFWFSVSGLFFIYQFLNLSEGWSRWVLVPLLNIWVYLAMLPVVHSIFGTFSLYQLLSIPLTLLFSLFYPLAIALHTVGLGSLADGWIVELLQLPENSSSVEVFTPLWILALFVSLSILALFRRVALYLQAGFILLFFLFLVKQIA
ncbi:competence protein [Hydrogenimonas sp.]|nr:competence protein [Hydrogenimonas sp.]